MDLYAISKDFIVPYLEVMENATDGNRIAAIKAFGNEPLPSIVINDQNNKDATIKIVGPLSPAGPSPLARFFGFGGTGYIEIIAAAKELEDDPTIDTVLLQMNTPGGDIVLMDEAREALISLASKKTVIAQNRGKILSAGYYLIASKNIKIEAMSPLALTGSIGVIIAGLDFTDSLAQEGIKRIKIISSNAPNKQADATTPQGLLELQSEVDAVERVFISKIASGRNTTDQDIIDNFGKGGVLIASDPNQDKPDALKVGMIDSLANSDIIIQNDNISPINAAGSGINQEGTLMDVTKLKAEHPAIYAEVLKLGAETGVGVGVAQERERVIAHITMGEAADDMKLAMSNIKDGVEHSPSSNAVYMASQMNKKSISDRKGESEGDLDTGGAGSDNNEGQDNELAIALAAKIGVDIDA